MAKKYINIKCSCCGFKIKRLIKNYNHAINRGQINFYCSNKCSIERLRDEFSPFRPLFNSCFKTSRNRNKEFNLTLNYVKSLWEKQNGLCSYTGIPMILDKYQDKHVPYSASLDRIDSKRGYVRGNVEFVCLFINYGKNRFLKSDIEKFLNIYLKYRKINKCDHKSRNKLT